MHTCTVSLAPRKAFKVSSEPAGPQARLLLWERRTKIGLGALRGPILSPLTGFLRGCEGRGVARVSFSSRSNVWPVDPSPAQPHLGLWGPSGSVGHRQQHFRASVHLCHLVNPSGPPTPPTELPRTQGVRLGWAHSAHPDIHHPPPSKDKEHLES